MNTPFDNIELITSYLAGSASDADKKLLTEWIQQSPKNREAFMEMKKTWLATSILANPKSFKSAKAFKLVSFEKQKNTSSFRLTYNNVLKVAAVLLVMLSISSLITYLVTKSSYGALKTEICTIEAPIGSRAVATLPDGTKVWLNACSKLEYNTNYNKSKREVKLTGEGYFNVSHNPEKPFLVLAKNVNIKALGTSFNVKAYPGENQVTTTLVEGKVEIKGKGINNQSFTYLMKPKQKVTYYDDNRLFKSISTKTISEEVRNSNRKEIADFEIPLQTKAPLVSNTNVKTELYTSWKDDRWLIESENLGELAVLFERRYNVHITFESTEIKQYRFSGTIQNETIEQIFDIMRFTLPISYEANKGDITLKADKKLKKIYNQAFKQK